MYKKTFVFYKEWRDAIKDLPDDVRLEFYDCIMEYAFTGKVEGLKPMVSIAFNFIKPTIDRDTGKYMSITERNKVNGSKGGRPKKESPNNPKKPSGLLENPKNLDNVNDYDNNIPPIIPPEGRMYIDSLSTNQKGEEKKKNPPLCSIEEEFESFRISYPGNKRGHKIEFDNFKKKHSDYKTAVYLLSSALTKLNEWRDKKKQLGQFVPEYANLSTWINQRRWECEYEKINESDDATETKKYDNGDFLR